MSEDDVLTGLLPRLTQLSNTLNRGRLYERAIAAAGVAMERPAITILAILNTADRPLRVGEIARQMQVEGPHATRHVHGLEQRGMVERVVDPDDRRARLIALTPVGESVVERYLSVVLGWFGDALSTWSREDRQHLDRLLGRMVDDLTGHLAKIDESG
jgi:DNA-binding MarR family transcriptional regulator